MSRLLRTSVLLATTALVVGLSPAATAGGGGNPLGDGSSGGGTADPVGDVARAPTQAVVTQAEIDSIDMTRLRWKVITGRYAAFRLHVVDLQPAGANRTFYGVTAHAGRATVLIAARAKHVVVVGDTGSHRCRGGQARFDERRDFVRLQLPVRCLSAKRYSFAPITLLQDPQGGTDIASDEVSRTSRTTIRR